MPYYTEEEFKNVVDIDGRKIKVGDILEDVKSDWPDNTWRYFVCFRGGNHIEIRDLNANNVGMCTTGLNGDVRVLGNYKEYGDKLGGDSLNADDLEYYFGEVK